MKKKADALKLLMYINVLREDVRLRPIKTLGPCLVEGMGGGGGGILSIVPFLYCCDCVGVIVSRVRKAL